LGISVAVGSVVCVGTSVSVATGVAVSVGTGVSVGAGVAVGVEAGVGVRLGVADGDDGESTMGGSMESGYGFPSVAADALSDELGKVRTVTVLLIDPTVMI